MLQMAGVVGRFHPRPAAAGDCPGRIALPVAEVAAGLLHPGPLGEADAGPDRRVLARHSRPDLPVDHVALLGFRIHRVVVADGSAAIDRSAQVVRV
jgi:hypothetical protein